MGEILKAGLTWTGPAPVIGLAVTHPGRVENEDSGRRRGSSKKGNLHPNLSAGRKNAKCDTRRSSLNPLHAFISNDIDLLNASGDQLVAKLQKQVTSRHNVYLDGPATPGASVNGGLERRQAFQVKPVRVPRVRDPPETE